MLGASLSPQHGASSGCGWRVAANILNKQPLTNDKGWSSRIGVERGANNPFALKINMLRKTQYNLGSGKIFWINYPSDGIWIRDLDYGM
jgi:hypothetical protein